MQTANIYINLYSILKFLQKEQKFLMCRSCIINGNRLGAGRAPSHSAAFLRLPDRIEAITHIANRITTFAVACDTAYSKWKFNSLLSRSHVHAQLESERHGVAINARANKIKDRIAEKGNSSSLFKSSQQLFDTWNQQLSVAIRCKEIDARREATGANCE